MKARSYLMYFLLLNGRENETELFCQTEKKNHMVAVGAAW